MLDVRYALKLSRKQNERIGISEELRGWSWDQPPVEPPVRGVELSVSDVASRYCRSMRDIYLRFVLGIKAKPTSRMVEGRVYHEVLRSVVEEMKKIAYGCSLVEGYEVLAKIMESSEQKVSELIVKILNTENLRLDDDSYRKIFDKGLKLWRFLALKYAASIDHVRSRHDGSSIDSIISQAIPQVAEYKVDGTPLGLSKSLSVDVFMPTYMVVDYKTGSRKNFHKLSTTGYALALEAELEVEVNAGATTYIWFNSKNLPRVRVEYHFIGDELRREFLETRDMLLEIIEHSRDPGLPSKCYSFCPYKSFCREGRE